MWYALGRASDLAFIQKRNLSVGSGNVLFLRLIRAKTSEEQGLSLFPDKSSFITCPLHAITMALAMQTFPVSSVLDLEHLSGLNVGHEAPATEATPLTDALVYCSDGDEPTNATPEATYPRRKSTPLKMQGYVNRVLKAASARQAGAGVSTGLSSHSFRRGGAQHANADASLSPQWIFDRGSWNMTATNKAFAYVFNTTNEDRKVSKVLSDWKSNDNPTIPSAATFDSATTTKIRRLGRMLFASSLDLGDASLIVDDQVADLLVASLIKHFPEVNERYPMSPYTSRMRMCLFPLQVSMPELLGWSVELKRQASEVREEEEKPFTRELQLINHLNAVIAQLVEANKAQSERIAELEKRVPVGGAVAPQAGSTPDTITDRTDLSLALDTPMKPTKPRVRAASKAAAATWFEWYTKTPRIWEVCDDRQYKSQSKQIVVYEAIPTSGIQP
ncbi:hypothetical protein PR001_g30243 [Phytophthora rubi]|uniref:Uncharacterized protein n=2 Tax=Phytophthora rubi TaxID=129364 RepID=A0A6A3GUR8_9STRA|nr:hypothetical protein PR001_g30243 [Phytophthora rubi]